MVDVVMVILIFFMATAAFMGDEWFLKAAIPTAPGPAASSTPKDPLELPPVRLNVPLELDDSGATLVSFLDLKRAPIDAFVQRLERLPKGKETETLEVLILPAANVPYRDVVRVHEACESRGIVNIGIGVRPRSATRPAVSPPP